MKTIQEYIDERPLWPDGTYLESAPMTQMQWLIWSLAAAGKFFVGYIVFMTGVTLPLISREFDISPAQYGLISAASLFGILLGAVGLGGMSDRFGRKPMFIFEMIIFVAFLVLLILSSNFLSVVICLFGLGLALGCDYPTAHMIISENIPSVTRGRLVLAAFGFQALGALGGTAAGLLVLSTLADLSAWRWMYATAVIPALVVTIGRFYVTESANWLHARGALDRAQRAATRLLVRKPQYPTNIRLAKHPADAAEGKHGNGGFAALFARQNRRATIFVSVPWFLQDLGTYGIGIFTPTILAATIGGRVDHVRSVVDLIADGIVAAKGAALITLLLIVGIIFAVLLADRVGRVSLQIIGFLGCAAGLLLASFSAYAAGETKLVLIFAGFMLFNFMTNLGPNAQTYLLAGEVFPTKIRGKGAGFAAAIGKIGAVATAFLFPILLAHIGTTWLLHILVVTSILGAIVTWQYRIETTGMNLDEIGSEAANKTQDLTLPTMVDAQREGKMLKTVATLTKSARGRMLSAVALALGMSALATPARAEGVTLVETGSSLLYPLFNIWVTSYARNHPGIHITTNATGSEAGIQKIISAEAQIGASDAFMSDNEVKRNPRIVNIPLCIAAQMVNYNLPGLNAEKLKLDGTVLAGIYSGKIRVWDDPQIAALNPSVNLPHHAIIPIRRADGSGDTFIFTQYLSFSDPDWESDQSYGMVITWPVVEGSLKAYGNAGMVQAIQRTAYSLAYIGVSYAEDIARAELGTALLKNESGNYLLPTKEAVQAAAAGLSSRTPPDERLTIVLSPGEAAYPLVSYEYAVVSTKQEDAATAAAIRKFLLWTIVPGETNESYLDSVHFIGLPPHIWELSQAQIQTIQ